MDGDFIVTAYMVLDKTMAALGHRDDVRARAGDAEVLMAARRRPPRYRQRQRRRAITVFPYTMIEIL